MKRLMSLSLFCYLFLHLCSAQVHQKEKGSFLPHSSSTARSVTAFNYTLSTFTDTYTELNGAISVNNGEIWDDPDYVIPLAFAFELNGHPVTELEFYGVGSLLRSLTSDPLVDTYVFPFEADLIDRGFNGGTSLSPISYTVEGPPGSQIQKIEWKNAGSYVEWDAFGTLDMYVNFQLWIFQGSNKIEFHYGPYSIDDPDTFYDTNPGAGAGVADYNETDDIISDAHFIIGAAGNPSLSVNPLTLTGTPDDGMVYRLSLSAPLEITLIGVDGTSFCNPDGSAMVTATGGTEPYTYLWNTGETTSAINNLSSGIYSVTVEDAGGSSATGSVNVLIPDPISVNAIATDETAVGANDGTAEAAPTDGWPPYSYQWSNGETSALIEGLAPGIYSVTVTDASDCTAEQSVTVNAFGCPTLTLEVGITQVSCHGDCNGSISVLQIGQGTAPFTFTWNTGATTPILQNLCPGEFGVTVVDANGCIVLGNYEITEPAELLVNGGTTPESLMNQNDGTAWAAPTGGTPPYIYEWDTGSTDSLLINLPPTNYSVTVTDGNFCTASQDLIVDPGACGILQGQILDATCFGECDGIIVATFINSTPPVTFIWSTGQTSSTITDLCPGDYSVTAGDAIGCVLIETFTVNEASPLFSNAGSTDETSIGGDGTAWAAPSGGTPPYSYSWSNGSTDSLIINLVPGEYTVDISDAHGCQISESVIVNAFVCVSLFPNIVNSNACLDTCTGQIDVFVFGAIGNVLFAWNTGDTISGISNLCAGQYSLTVTDEGNGCSITSVFDVEQLVPLALGVDEVIHLTDSTSTAISITGTGGIPPYTFLWQGPNGYISLEEDLAGITPGSYTVTIFDANGCQITIDSIEVLDQTVSTYPIFGFDISIHPNPTTEKVYIKLPEMIDFKVELFSAHGLKVLEEKNETTLDVHTLPVGFYLLKLTSGDKYLVHPLIIQR